jgi:acyl carrier protein
MVDPEKFLDIFSNQFEESVRRTISLQSTFKQIGGWSSLQALIITVAIHDEWGVSFSDDDFRNSQTVNDLLNITQQKTGK